MLKKGYFWVSKLFLHGLDRSVAKRAFLGRFWHCFRAFNQGIYARAAPELVAVYFFESAGIRPAGRLTFDEACKAGFLC